MLNDNAYRHHDAQQHQPVGFHTAPLEKVTLGIKNSFSFSFSDHCTPPGSKTCLHSVECDGNCLQLVCLDVWGLVKLDRRAIPGKSGFT